MQCLTSNRDEVEKVERVECFNEHENEIIRVRGNCDIERENNAS